jgi:hypothetical protein
LYDKSDSNYRDQNRKSRIWAEIATQAGFQGKIFLELALDRLYLVEISIFDGESASKQWKKL